MRKKSTGTHLSYGYHFTHYASRIPVRRLHPCTSGSLWIAERIGRTVTALQPDLMRPNVTKVNEKF